MATKAQNVARREALPIKNAAVSNPACCCRAVRVRSLFCLWYVRRGIRDRPHRHVRYVLLRTPKARGWLQTRCRRWPASGGWCGHTATVPPVWPSLQRRRRGPAAVPPPTFPACDPCGTHPQPCRSSRDSGGARDTRVGAGAPPHPFLRPPLTGCQRRRPRAQAHHTSTPLPTPSSSACPAAPCTKAPPHRRLHPTLPQGVCCSATPRSNWRRDDSSTQRWCGRVLITPPPPAPRRLARRSRQRRQRALPSRAPHLGCLLVPAHRVIDDNRLRWRLRRRHRLRRLRW